MTGGPQATAANKIGSKKVKGERYSQDQAQLLEKLAEKAKYEIGLREPSISADPNQAQNDAKAQQIQNQKEELVKKLEKANRDNKLLMQII